uniref:Polyprotein n=1 Tax=Cajanus cajan TaxID=3821 RepID=A0A151S862_CAJCA|nr:polyprotein [Cajanus cajan]
METSASDTQPAFLNTSLSLPNHVSRTLAPKIENLVEFSYVPKDAQISESTVPLLSPYNIFKCQRSTLRSIRQLVRTTRPHEKEYVQSSKMEQCSLMATSEEQYVTIEITKELI